MRILHNIPMRDIPPYVVSIAPMMEHTDRFFRVFMRLLTKKTWLYTEMISAGALVHGDADGHLAFDEVEKPVVLQLGGSDAHELAKSVKIANEYNYDEINLNVGCPSERVHCGGFGASLMARVEETQKIVEAMRAVSNVPVTVKCRIGIDGTRIGLPAYEEYEHLLRFATCMHSVGATRLAVHARIAVLGGLSPRQNREIPPLKYDYVRRLKQDLVACFIEINGGITTLESTREHLQHLDAVMIGRAAVDDPCMFFDADALIDEHVSLSADKTTLEGEAFGKREGAAAQAEFEKRASIARGYGDYLQHSLQRVAVPQSGPAYQRMSRMHSLALRHSMNLFAGMRGAKLWRQAISTHMHARTEPQAAIDAALQPLEQAYL